MMDFYSLSKKPVIRAQFVICITAIVLFGIKMVAWWLTNSIAVLTDALESTVNVVTGLFGLYTLILSSLPRDDNHPYGHGKVEFLSAAVEGILILSAGSIIVYEAILNLGKPHEIQQLDLGILLIAISAIFNYWVGWRAIKLGRRMNTLPLVSSGKHLHSDTWSTLGIIVGLIFIKVTGILWMDSLFALIFACIIIYTGIKIIRVSLAGIMDETDKKLLQEMVAYLELNRRPNWVDLHNLRIIKYGSILHLDCHITVPWYLNVNEAHEEVSALENLVKNKFGEQVELFVHTDGCLDFSCGICALPNCDKRQSNFVLRKTWTVENIISNRKHRVE